MMPELHRCPHPPNGIYFTSPNVLDGGTKRAEAPKDPGTRGGWGLLRRLLLPSPPVQTWPRKPIARTRLTVLPQLPTSPTILPALATPETARKLALSLLIR